MSQIGPRVRGVRGEALGLRPSEGTSFAIDFAAAEERKAIMATMRAEGRQTMNLRLMPTAQLLTLKTSDGDIIGWAGFDYRHNPAFPELFSQFVAPDFRHFLLGLALVHSRALILQENGVKEAFFRMDAGSNADLLELRTNLKLYRTLSKEEVDPEWQSYCTKCELHQKTCLKQVYLAFSVDDLVTFGNRRLGTAQDFALPKALVLRHGSVRRSEPLPAVKARWAA